MGTSLTYHTRSLEEAVLVSQASISLESSTRVGADCSAQVIAHKTKSTWHHIRSELHNLLIAGVPVSGVAERFGVSERTVYSWKKSLNKELLASEDIDDLTLVVDGIEQYKMLRAEAWQKLHLAETTNDQVKFLRLLLSIENGYHRLLKYAGAYDGQPLAKGSSEARDVRLHMANR